MLKTITLRLTIALALAGVLSATPAQAQKKGEERERSKRSLVQERERERPQLRRRATGKDADKDAKAREQKARRGQEERELRSRGVSLRRDDDRWEDDDRWGDDDRWEDDRREGRGRRGVPPGWCKGRGNPHNTPENCGYRGDRRYDRDDDYERGRSGSYAEEHEAFHRWLDRKYSDLAAERPLDPVWQVRIRADKKAEHDRWHERAGRAH